MPTGVAARCFISTMVPTVPAPGGRWGRSTEPAASSSMPMRNGVAETGAAALALEAAEKDAVAHPLEQAARNPGAREHRAAQPQTHDDGLPGQERVAREGTAARHV